jgi:hypothetical protein
MDGIGYEHVKLSKPDSEKQVSCFVSYMESRLSKRRHKIEGGQLGKKKGMSRKWRGQRGKWKVNYYQSALYR